MFLNVDSRPLAYTDPWNASLHERRRALVTRSRHVAYVCERPDSSTFRYRVFNMVEALEAAPELDISAAWFTTDDLRRDLGFVDRADAVVICRTRYSDDIAALIARARARGVRVIYDVDDLIFDPDHVQLIMQTLDVDLRSDTEWNHWFAYVGRLGATLRHCDAAIATNGFLAEQISAHCPHLEVASIPNFLNRLQTEVSRTLMAAKRAGDLRRDGTVDLGYFSGSPTHNRDLLIASPALATVFERFPSTRLRVAGFIELNEYLAPYHDRIVRIPMQDYLNLQRVTADVEVAIAPLQGNIFTNCKSELKYFEAGVVGVLTVASPTFTFVRAIADGVNGFLARSHEWLEKLSDCIALVENDPAGHAEMVERVVADSEQRYAWNGHGEAIAAAVFGTSA